MEENNLHSLLVKKKITKTNHEAGTKITEIKKG